MHECKSISAAFRIEWRRGEGEPDGPEKVGWVDEDKQLHQLGDWLQDSPVEDQYAAPQNHQNTPYHLP